MNRQSRLASSSETTTLRNLQSAGTALRQGLLPILVLTFAVDLSGCSRERTATSSWAGTIDTLPGGAVLVKNPSQGVWDSTNGWRIVEAARIGTDGEGPASFGQIYALAVDPAGRIYVLDGDAQEIRVFDSTGIWIRTIGRRGGGPGEFQQASGMVWDSAGRLWVVDQQNATYSILDTSGTLVESRRRSSTTSSTIPWPGVITRTNKLVEWQSAGFDAAPKLLRLDAGTLAIEDSFALPAFTPEVFELRRKSGSNVSMMRMGVPFAPELVWWLDGDGDLWFGVSDQYRILRRSLAGDTMMVIDKPFTPIPVSNAAKDSMIKRMEWFTSQGGEIDESRIPHLQTAFSSFVVDDRGYLWVRPTGGPAGRTPLDVFDPEGRYLGRVELPFKVGYSTPLIQGDQVYAITSDSMDIPYVVRARIEKPGGR